MISCMKSHVSIALLFFLTVASPCMAEKVCSVHDGDTFTLCSGQKVRIWGIDAPELNQPMGRESGRYMRSLVLGQEVGLQCNGKSYKRAVCSVAVDLPSGRVDPAREMVRHGYAYDSAKYSMGYYRPDEEQAKAQKVGVWSQPNGGERPWLYRHKAH